jgi:hypothetical protein
MRFLIYILIALNIGYVAYLRREVSFQKDIAKMNYDYFLAAIKERNEAQDKLKEMDDSNYILTEKIKYTEGQNEYMIDRCQALWKRLRGTTAIVETISTCPYFKPHTKQCIGKFDLEHFLEENRKANF